MVHNSEYNMFRRPGHRHHPPFRPPMPFGPAMIKELSQLVFLWNIKEEREGITGYDLQKYYKAKQTNVYRALKDMESKGYLVSEETIINGRAQKLYHITEEGNTHLKQLRDKWTSRIAFLSDVVPTERPPVAFMRKRFQHDFYQVLEEITSKDEFSTYIEGFKAHLKKRQNRLKHQIEAIDNNLNSLNELIREVEQLEQYDPEIVKIKIKEYLEK